MTDHWTFHTCLVRRISGRVGDTVYVYRNGKQHARPYVKPRNPKTPAQHVRRSAFAEAIRAWKALPVEEKEALNREARRLKRSGYNLFISRYMREAVHRRLVISSQRTNTVFTIRSRRIVTHIAFSIPAANPVPCSRKTFTRAGPVMRAA